MDNTLTRNLLAILSLITTASLHAQNPPPPQPFRIEVVDGQNGWPVPLVHFRTTHHVDFVTDNAGLIAVDAPDLMNREVYFHVQSDGYELPADGFGYRGVRLKPTPGATARVELRRTMLAKRIGRLTGAGRFVHEQRLAEPPVQPNDSWSENGVFGCDSVLTIAHRGKRFWLWGDTTMAYYPLGLFHSSSATTSLRPLASLEPPLRLRFDYFVDDTGNPRNVAEMPGRGPTWLSGYVSLPDSDGNAKLLATYVKIKPPLEAYEKGLCVWNEETENFERLKVLWEQSKSPDDPASPPEGHPTFWDDADGKRWVLFGDPLPKLRCEPTMEAWQDPDAWEVLSPQVTIPAASDSTAIRPHRGSIAWSSYGKRWVTVFVQEGGTPSFLGEVWFAEADSPLGPWAGAVKILSHEKYSFYNPRIHADMTEDGSPVLLFEGTYTKQFSGNSIATPRYDYNQILYRLDLDEL